MTAAAVRYGMWRRLRVVAIVALVVACSTTVNAQASDWSVSGGTVALVEAWDYNEAKESLFGVVVGVDRRIWRRMSARAEGLALRVRQIGEDAWLRGFTVGTRARWPQARLRPFVELAVGLSDSTAIVPVRGTSFNYLLLSGAGVEVPAGNATFELGARWLHVSNNGRDGNHRNPDIQSLGLVVAVVWEPR
jgi:hypothetical protein